MRFQLVKRRLTNSNSLIAHERDRPFQTGNRTAFVKPRCSTASSHLTPTGELGPTAIRRTSRTYGSKALQDRRTPSIKRPNRGSLRRLARNGSYFDSHGALMNPNSTARPMKSSAVLTPFPSADQSAAPPAKY